MENKKELLKIAKDMDLKGITKLTKKELIQFILENPCTNLTFDDCNKKTREELRNIARKCNVKITKKTNPQVCDEIISKYKNINIPKFKSPPKQSSPKSLPKSPPKQSSPKSLPKSSPPKQSSPKQKSLPKSSLPKSSLPKSSLPKQSSPKQFKPLWETETIETGKVVSPLVLPEPEWVSKLLDEDEPNVQIKTNKTPKQVIAEVMKTDFDKLVNNRSSNFTDTLKLSKGNLVNTDCKLHITSVKELNSTGASGAGIFSAVLQNSKNDVIIKIWKVDEKHVFKNHELLSCLDGEWNIYTYIIPYIFNNKLCPNVLIPIDSGICHVNELKPKIAKINMTTTEIAKYITTAYVPESLNTFMYNDKKDKDMITIYFQTIYTLATMNKIGMRHNDIHTGNVRILECAKKPFKLAYTLKNKVIYCNTKHLCLLNDFDRSGISTGLAKKFNIRNLCTETNGYQCKYVHQCNTSDGGRRDLIVFSYYILNSLPRTMRLYIISDILCSTKPAQMHFIKYVAFDDKNVTIDYGKSKNHEYLYFKLSEKQIYKMYPDIEKIINSNNFIFLCTKLSSNLKLKVSDQQDYDVYNLYKSVN